jgi:hypothetical protein
MEGRGAEHSQFNLNSALNQTGCCGPEVTEGNWQGWNAEKLKIVEWAQVERDLKPFLLRSERCKVVP